MSPTKYLLPYVVPYVVFGYSTVNYYRVNSWSLTLGLSELDLCDSLTWLVIDVGSEPGAQFPTQPRVHIGLTIVAGS